MKKYLTIMLLVFTVAYASQAQVSFSSLESEIETEIQVDMYPNPAVSYINVTLQLIPETDKEPILEIYNVLGNKIRAEITEQSRRSYRVDLSNLPSGYYFISIKIPESDIYKTSKFLKREL